MARDSSSTNNDDVAFQKAAIGTIAKRLFGHAILASVRRNAVLRRTLWEAFLCASIAALVGRFQFGLPLLTCFLAILVLYAEAIAQVHYAELYNLYRKWTTFRRRVYLAAFVFAFLRLMVWKGFGIPPAEAYAAMARAGGFMHVFWYGNAPAIVLLELQLTLVLGYLSCLIVFHKHRRAVSVAAALVAVAVVFWAMPLSDAELAEEGIVGVVANRLGRLSGATPGELEAHGVIGSAYYRTKALLFGANSPAPSVHSPSSRRESAATAHALPVRPNKRRAAAEQGDQLAAHARAQRGFPGEWHYHRADGQQATLMLATEENSFAGEYRFGDHVEPLRGELQPDGRLHLVNTRQVGKLVRPGTWYEGDFSQDAWLRLSADGNSVIVDTSTKGPAVIMERKPTDTPDVAQE